MTSLRLMQKVLYGLGVLFILGAVVWLLRGAPGIRIPTPEERARQKALEELERPFREDPYGGNTAEETRQIFLEALRKGDIELAVKYFAPDRQERWRKNLLSIKAAGKFEEMISDLSRAEVEPKLSSDTLVIYEIVDQENLVIGQIKIFKSLNGKWKIDSI
ncbi:DUF4878 domain-containing protein [Candidatus Azambacteria bacterium]|nr:DUF4878 domain-containing protein [Candidatus Azambacteria bacterium]